jgi:hypothetical protein
MLPKLVTPKYDMIVPSTGKSITYRPYVVKEEKILLIALESQDNVAIENAVLDIIKACVESPIDVNKLATFDIEYIFVNLRSKSVGEGVTINPECINEDCESRHEIKINIDELTVANIGEAKERLIKLTDDISIELRWLTMKDRLVESEGLSDTDSVIQTIAKSIETIYSGEEIFAVTDSKPEEVIDFVESLNTDQFAMIINKMSKAPNLSYKFEYDCKECGTHNERELKGLTDFFQ